jgi:hypothetical protein
LLGTRLTNVNHRFAAEMPRRHGCLFVAETSCETRNDLLDRSLVTDTLEGAGAGYL